MTLTGLVLAGGRGRRMGADKARLVVDGQTLVRRVATRLATGCQEVLVASGDGRRLGELPWRQIADAVAGTGPLGGIVAGLEAARTPLVAVVAVDLPSVDPDVLRRLADVIGDDDAAVPVVDGRWQPLHAVFAVGAAATLRAELEAGERAVHRAIRTLRVRTVGPDGWRDLDPDGRFARDLDHPEDLDGMARGGQDPAPTSNSSTDPAA